MSFKHSKRNSNWLLLSCVSTITVFLALTFHLLLCSQPHCWSPPNASPCGGHSASASYPFLTYARAATVVPTSSRPIRIGIVGDFDQQVGALLQATVDGISTAVFDFNRTGGVIEIANMTAPPLNGHGSGTPSSGASVVRRMMAVVVQHTPEESDVAPAVDGWMADDARTGVEVIAVTPARRLIDVLGHRGHVAVRHGLLVLGPTSGDRADFLRPSPEMALVTPSPDAELTALLRELTHATARPVRRIAIMTNFGTPYGVDMVPFMHSAAAEAGMEIVFHYIVRHPNATILEQTGAARGLGIQALLMYGDIVSATAEALGFILAQLPFTATIIAPYLATFLITYVLGQLPRELNAVEGRIITSLYGPLYADTRFEVVRDFHAASAAIAASVAANASGPVTVYSPAVLSANPVLGSFAVMGYVVGRVFAEIVRSVSPAPITRSAILNATFASTLFPAGDVVLGPYSLPCTGQRAVGCDCHSGARTVQLATVTPTLGLKPLRDAFHIPLTTCSPIGVALRGPRRHLLIGPAPAGNARAALEAYAAAARVARSAADTAFDRRAVVELAVNITSDNATEVLSALATIEADAVVTMALGPVFLGEVPRGNTSVLVDPLSLAAPLYEGFSPRIVHVQATLEQEMHALAAAHGRGGIAAVIAACPAVNTAANAVGDALRNSLHTFQFDTFGGTTAVEMISSTASSTSSSALAAALDAIQSTPKARCLLVHGLRNEADLQALQRLLARHPQLNVALPFAHVRVFYDALIATIPDRQTRARLVFATALPNWNPSVRGSAHVVGARSALMAAFWDAMHNTSLTSLPSSVTPATSPLLSSAPQALAGFISERLVAGVAARVPERLSGASFLDMLYAVSTVVVDAAAFTIGPLSRAPCPPGRSSGDGCESNIGPRLLHVRTLDQATAAYTAAELSADPTMTAAPPAALVEPSTAFASGAVQYQTLPVAAGVSAWIVAIATAGASIAALVGAAAAVLWLCTGRSHRHAPTDPSHPLTIVFTDIQSSTALWAEAPDAMGPALEAHHATVRGAIARHRGYEVKTIGDAFMIAFREADDAVACAVAIQRGLLAGTSAVHSTAAAVGTGTINQAYIEFEMDAASANKETEEDYERAKGEEQDVTGRKRKRPKGGTTRRLPTADLSPEAYGRLWHGLRVRVGIHTGLGEIQKDPVTGSYDYYGTVVNTAARVEAAGHGGQILVTKATMDALRAPPPVTATDAMSCVQPPRHDRVLDSMDTASVTAQALGAVELRGLPLPVALFQIDAVEGRQFPPLRTDNAANRNGNAIGATANIFGTDSSAAGSDPLHQLSSADDGVASDSSAHHHDGQPSPAGSSHSGSPKRRPSVALEMGIQSAACVVPAAHVMAALAATFVILRPAQRRDELQRLAALWRARNSSGGSLASAIALGLARGDAATAAALDALARRVSGIASRTLRSVVVTTSCTTTGIPADSGGSKQTAPHSHGSITESVPNSPEVLDLQ